MDTINDRIFSLRAQAGISQQRLADDLNLSRRAISLWKMAEEHRTFNQFCCWLTTFRYRWIIWSRAVVLEK